MIISRSREPVATVVLSEPLLFVVCVSPGVDTVTVLVNVPIAVGVTVSRMLLLCLEVSGPGLVQVTLGAAKLQLQPELPAAAVAET